MLYREIIAVYSEIHTKHINTLCGQNVEYLGAFHECEKLLLASSRLPVCPSDWKNSAPTGRIFMKFYIWVIFENMSRIFKFN